AVADGERLVVDEQPDDLAVRDVHHRLSGLRVAVAPLGVRKGPHLVERVEVRAGYRVGFPLVEVAPEADVPIGERKERLGLRHDVEVKVRLGQSPWVNRECRVIDHHSSSSSARSETTISAPCANSSLACPTRSAPTT